MIFFGHIGITAGVAKISEICLSLSKPVIAGNEVEKESVFVRLVNGLRNRLGHIDYRMVMVGSILPDIIDKPVFLLFGNTFILSGRDYAHTLLFNLVLLVTGLVLLYYRKSWLLVISLASIMHLILDRMWEYPAALFWPLLGPLSGGVTTGWISERWYSIFTVPEAYIPEIIGIMILAVFFYRLVRKKRIRNFIIKGVID